MDDFYKKENEVKDNQDIIDNAAKEMFNHLTSGFNENEQVSILNIVRKQVIKHHSDKADRAEAESRELATKADYVQKELNKDII